MKKIVLGIALASFVIACKKIPQGGSLGRLKLEEGTERYSDDPQGTYHESSEKDSMTAEKDSTAIIKPSDSAKAQH